MKEKMSTTYGYKTIEFFSFDQMQHEFEIPDAFTPHIIFHTWICSKNCLYLKNMIDKVV